MKTKSKTQTKSKATCPECGMSAKDWTGNQGKGIEKNGTRYCCEGCAQGTGCICEDRD